MAEVDRSPAPWRALHRSSEGRWLGGVAAGLAETVGVDPAVVRVGFVLLAAAGGWGVLVYAVAFALLADAPSGAAAPTERRAAQRVIGWVMIGLGGLLVLTQAGLGLSAGAAWPLLPIALAAAVLHDLRPAPTDRRAVVRLAAGLGLAALGVWGFLSASLSVRALQSFVTAVVLVGALALLSAPWWWGLAQELAEERRARIRSEARAELAAHLHDSVLQTLALIQRRADDPQAAAALARRQERELRRWLYGGPQRVDGADLRSALRDACAEVEDAHGVAVDLVVVGDAEVELDERSAALVAAVREAAVNAAKFARVASIDVYAELGADQVEVYVRDRGVGFDPAAVAADRRGLAESVLARMRRAGGRAQVTSAPGEGAEVELVLPIERGGRR
ncbi:MAG: PspC domain-containing protein [Acidimicrobiales bacterium]